MYYYHDLDYSRKNQLKFRSPLLDPSISLTPTPSLSKRILLSQAPLNLNRTPLLSRSSLLLVSLSTAKPSPHKVQRVRPLHLIFSDKLARSAHPARFRSRVRGPAASPLSSLSLVLRQVVDPRNFFQRHQVLTEEVDLAETSILNRLRQLNALSYPMVTTEATHSAPQQIKTEYQTVQSELQSATGFGDTVLHLLVTKCHNELALKVFQSDKSLLKARNKMLETPLHIAAKIGNDEVFQMLIRIDYAVVKNALEETNENGDTILHVAVRYVYRP